MPALLCCKNTLRALIGHSTGTGTKQTLRVLHTILAQSFQHWVCSITFTWCVRKIVVLLTNLVRHKPKPLEMCGKLHSTSQCCVARHQVSCKDVCSRVSPLLLATPALLTHVSWRNIFVVSAPICTSPHALHDSLQRHPDSTHSVGSIASTMLLQAWARRNTYETQTPKAAQGSAWGVETRKQM